MTKGEQLCHAACFCNPEISSKTCLPCQIDEALLKEKEPLRKKLVEYENGFWGRVATSMSYRIKQLTKKLREYESLRHF